MDGANSCRVVPPGTLMVKVRFDGVPMGGGAAKLQGPEEMPSVRLVGAVSATSSRSHARTEKVVTRAINS